MKTYISIIVFGICFLGLNAQQSNIGLEYGLALNSVNGSNVIANSILRLGSSININYEYITENNISFQVEANYHEKGVRNRIIYLDEFGKRTGEEGLNSWDYDYVSFPIKIGHRTKGKNYMVGRLGIIPSFLTHAKRYDTLFEEEVDLTDSVDKFDIGVSLEVEAYHTLSKNLGFTYSIMLNQSLNSFTNANYFSGFVMRHYGVVISGGLKYSLSKSK